MTFRGFSQTYPVRNEAQTHALENALEYARSQERNRLGEYVLANSAKRGVQAEKTSIQNWIGNHREKFQDDRSEKNNSEAHEKIENVTYHGLRHSFARELYSEALEKHIELGENQADAEYHARLDVSHQLGHGRDSVTQIYLT